jgi:hypothetical protein
VKYLEHDNQVAIFNWAATYAPKYPALYCMFAIPNGGHRHISVAMKLKAEGVKAGVPDIFLAQGDVSGTKYYGLFIEMKSEHGRSTPEQLSWCLKLEQAGYKCVICHSWVEAAKEICDYLGMEKEKERLR